MTNIEWVKNPDNQTQGVSINSKTGCLNHDQGLCKGGGFPCYAYKLAHGRLKQRYLNNQILPVGQFDDAFYTDKPLTDPFYPRFWPGRLAAVRQIQKPTGIFLDDMSDWMGEYWPKEWTEMELQVMKNCPQHRFYTLTKQPQQLMQWSPFPENCWVGVTATGAKAFKDALSGLSDIKATVRFISIEPMLERIYHELYVCQDMVHLLVTYVDWLIIGACTGTLQEIKALCQRYPDLTPVSGKLWTAQPKLEWLSEIVGAADKADVKVFLKNNLAPLIHADALSGQYALDTGLLNWEGQLRQEMPK